MDAVQPLEVFLIIAMSSLFSFGGGSGQVPVIQGRWVEPGLLAPELFSFALALTYLTPGPKAGFIAAIGYYLAGLPGVVAGMLGLVLPTVIGAAGVSYALKRMERIVEFIQPSAGFVIAALIAAAAWGTAVPLQFQPGEIAAVAAVTVTIVAFDLDPVWLILGAIAVGLAWSIAF